MKIKITDRLIYSYLILVVLMFFVFIYLSAKFIRFFDQSSPFWAFVFLVALLAFALVYDILQKRRANKHTSMFINAAKLFLRDYSDEFAEFYNLYSHSKKNFLLQYNNLVETSSNFDFKKLQPKELLYLFADSKKLVNITDYRGEENEHEVEEFLKTLAKSAEWKNTDAFRKRPNAGKLQDNQFIVGLFKAINKDLRIINQQLIFLELNWDAYVYTCIDIKTAKETIKLAPQFFHNVRKLR